MNKIKKLLFELKKNYLIFPITNGTELAKVNLIIDGKSLREFDIELAVNKGQINFWSFLDISIYNGKTAEIQIDCEIEKSPILIFQTNKIPNTESFYKEPLRPQFHFSQKIGWNNDPNGMVYHNKEWNLFFQHNPYGIKWGNMHWGHAVSKNLVHWEQLPIAIYNKKRDDAAFSGSAIIDLDNTAGWKTGKNDCMVAAWTSTGRGECISYSNDNGRTFQEFEGNPVIKHNGRDPKIIWYKPNQHWVMAVFGGDNKLGYIEFYSSNNLKDWKLESKIANYYECPELFELPLNGDKNNTRWVIFSGDAKYTIGQFDGKTFTPEHKEKYQLHYGLYYASQLFNNSPDDRKIQIGWAKIEMVNMPFNQTFSFPHELSLRKTEDGIRLFAEPINEIELLYKDTYVIKNKILSSDKSIEIDVSGKLFDIEITFDIGNAKSIDLVIGKENIIYNISTCKIETTLWYNGKLLEVKLKPINKQVQIRVLVDNSIIEIIGNNGQVYITKDHHHYNNISNIKTFVRGGKAEIISFIVHELNSIWENIND